MTEKQVKLPTSELTSKIELLRQSKLEMAEVYRMRKSAGSC